MADTENSGDCAMARPGHEHVAAVRTRLAEQRWDWIAWWRAEEREQMDGEVRQALNATPASVIADVLEAAAELGLLAAASTRPLAGSPDDLDAFITEQRIKDPEFGSAYDDAVARLVRERPSVLAAMTKRAFADPMATHSPDDGHPQCVGRVVRMDDVEYGYRQTTTTEPVPTSTRSFAEEEVESMAGWPDAAVMVRPVGAWRVAGRDVRGELRWLIDQRAAVPGRPEEGPYPASLDELADEVAVWVRKLAPSLSGLVAERLATTKETSEAGR